METNSPFLVEIEVDAENHRDMLDDGAFVVLIERYGRFRLVRAGRLADGRSYEELFAVLVVDASSGKPKYIVLEYVERNAEGPWRLPPEVMVPSRSCSQRFRHPGFVEGAFPFSEPEYGGSSD